MRRSINEQLSISSLPAIPCTVLSCKANMPQPLPNNPFPAGTPAHQAYTTCQTLEAGVPLVNWSGPPTSVRARLLGYLIIHAPTVAGHTDVTNEINSCNNDEEKLHTLAQFYINHFLRICE